MYIKTNQNQQEMADLVPFVLLRTLFKLLYNLNVVMAVHYFFY